MTTAAQIRDTQANRLAYLVFVYEKWQQVRSGNIQSLPATVVHEHLGMSRDEGSRIEHYLNDKGLIKFMSMGPSIAITDYGVDYVEQALAEPDWATEYFPPINVLHIEKVINSQVQQGTVNSNQTGEWAGITADQLAAIIAEVKSLADMPLSTEQRQDFDANLQTLEAQAKASRPSKTIIREALSSIRTIAEEVGAALVASKILAFLSGAAAATL